MKCKNALLFLSINYLIILIYGFNLDTDFPIIYEDPEANTSKRPTYFGYSVMVFSKEDYHWIQVGAPRANGTENPIVIEPGLIYRCKLKGYCQPYYLETEGNRRVIEEGYHDIKNGSWLGSVMVLQKDAEIMTICAPRWTNQIHTYDWKMQGMCYTTSASEDSYNSTTVNKMIPLIGNDSYTRPNWGNKKIYYYMMGQAGMSAYYTKDEGSEGLQLILGAPGFLNWRGSTILYTAPSSHNSMSKRSLRKRTRRMEGPIIAMTIETEGARDSDYIGYSVAAGRFFPSRERLYVAGAPRANNYLGRVIIYQFPEKTNDPMRVIQVIIGEHFGSYFGATLEVGNLTKDSYEDLLVSAPEHTTPAVYIYLGSRRGSLIVPSIGLQVLEGGPLFGRKSHFGAALSIADLDLDGNNEVIVGAPYAEDGRGAIAIWAGSDTGPKGNGPPTWILKASQFYESLRGFGISIAPPMDLDNNYYPELVVGAHLSGHIVVFRGRPVVQLNVFFDGNSTIQLQRESKNLTIPICLKYYTSVNSTQNVYIRKNVTIDTVFKRAYHLENKKASHNYIDITPVNSNGIFCENLEITIKDLILNYFDPIVITVKANVIEYEAKKNVVIVKSGLPTVEDNFNKFYPVGYEANANLEIPYSTGCGTDDICHCDLMTHVTTANKIEKFILGSDKSIVLQITINNFGEPAYLTRIKLTLPSFTSLTVVPPACKMEETDVICKVENPLRHNKTLSIEIDMQEVSINRKYINKLEFIVEAITKSVELNPDNNIYKFHLPLETEAQIAIVGKSLQDIYTYTLNKDGISEKPVIFKQLFEVQKVGASSVEEVLLTFRMPYIYKTRRTELTFITLHQPEGQQSDQPFFCSSDNYAFAATDDEILSDDFIQQESVANRSKREISNSDLLYPRQLLDLVPRHSFVKRDIDSKVSTVSKDTSGRDLLDNRTVRISCNKENFYCLEINCRIGPFRRSHAVARLLLTMSLNISLVKDIMDKKDILVIKSQGNAIIEDTWNHDKSESNVYVESIIVGSPVIGIVALWLIIMSVILGLLLLTLLVYFLYRAGFFKRKIKDDLEALRKKNDQEVDDMCSEDLIKE